MYKIGTLLLGLYGAQAGAGSVSVTPAARCGGKVQLKAQDAKLSEVLQALAQKLDFQLEFKSQHDPLINTDTQRPPPS